MNQTSKPWYLSKGFVGPLATAILFALRTSGVVDIDTDTALGLLYQGAEFVGIVFAMVGRAMARSRLTSGMETFQGSPGDASPRAPAGTEGNPR